MENREEHCAFAILDSFKEKCIACCHRNDGDTDCIGRTRKTPVHEFEGDNQYRRLWK